MSFPLRPPHLNTFPEYVLQTFPEKIPNKNRNDYSGRLTGKSHGSSMFPLEARHNLDDPATFVRFRFQPCSSLNTRSASTARDLCKLKGGPPLEALMAPILSNRLCKQFYIQSQKRNFEIESPIFTTDVSHWNQLPSSCQSLSWRCCCSRRLQTEANSPKVLTLFLCHHLGWLWILVVLVVHKNTSRNMSAWLWPQFRWLLSLPHPHGAHSHGAHGAHGTHGAQSKGLAVWKQQFQHVPYFPSWWFWAFGKVNCSPSSDRFLNLKSRFVPKHFESCAPGLLIRLHVLPCLLTAFELEALHINLHMAQHRTFLLPSDVTLALYI